MNGWMMTVVNPTETSQLDHIDNNTIQEQLNKDVEVNNKEVHEKTPEEIFQSFNTSPSGLTQEEADERLLEFGKNELRPPYQPGFFVKLWLQINNILILILIVAGVISGVLSEWADLALIAAVIIVNVSLGMLQEAKAEKATAAIRDMLAPRATVLRDGRQSIDASLLVPGDVIFVQSGDSIPADIRFFSCTSVRALEAPLTGESVPVMKSTETSPAQSALGDRVGMGYAATTVMQGQGLGVVVATGDSTEIGKIGSLVSQAEEKPTALQTQLEILGRWTAVIAILISVTSYLIVDLWREKSSSESFHAAVGIAVALIPEGLPAVVTITLAIGVQHMADQNAIIRKMHAVETLGAINVICSDKTGTLTKNEMTVVNIITSEGTYAVTGVGYEPKGEIKDPDGQVASEATKQKLQSICMTGLLCNDGGLRPPQSTNTQTDSPGSSNEPINDRNEEGGKSEKWDISGDPTDVALLTLGMKLGVENINLLQKNNPRLGGVPFESEHKFQASIHEEEVDGEIHYVAHIKGAPEQLITRCSQQVIGNDMNRTGPIDEHYWLDAASQMSRRGLRLIALCIMPIPNPRFEESEGETTPETTGVPSRTVVLSVDDVKTGPKALTMLALTAILDPPREECISAIKQCHEAGVTVKMITGDHKETAAAIGRMLGLGTDEVVKDAEYWAQQKGPPIPSRLLHFFPRRGRQELSRSSSDSSILNFASAIYNRTHLPPSRSPLEGPPLAQGPNLPVATVAASPPTTPPLALTDRENGEMDPVTPSSPPPTPPQNAETATTARVITGPEVDAMTDEDLEKEVLHCNVFARASPETKIRIVRALQSHRQVVAMTGDGVNDAPAIKAADVGIAMGITGTDVTKGAAKMVLADDNFATTVAAIREGRCVFDNLVKICVVTLPTNLGQGLSIFFSYIVNTGQPLTSMQVLWVNMVTSSTIGVVLAFEPPEPSIMDKPPRKPKKRLLGKFVLWRLLLVTTLIVVVVIINYWWSVRLGEADDRARTVAMNTLAMSQCAYAVNCRFLRRTAFQKDIFLHNNLFWAGILLVFLLQILVTYTPGIQSIFNTAFINGLDWLRVLGLSLGIFVIIEIEKALGPRYINPIILPAIKWLVHHTPSITLPVPSFMHGFLGDQEKEEIKAEEESPELAEPRAELLQEQQPGKWNEEDVQTGGNTEGSRAKMSPKPPHAVTSPERPPTAPSGGVGLVHTISSGSPYSSDRSTTRSLLRHHTSRGSTASRVRSNGHEEREKETNPIIFIATSASTYGYPMSSHQGFLSRRLSEYWSQQPRRLSQAEAMELCHSHRKRTCSITVHPLSGEHFQVQMDPESIPQEPK